MKTALVTGANRGIGLELVHQLKHTGHIVIACCRDAEAAKGLGPVADKVIQIDVRKDHDIYNLVQALKDRPIDLLINNAGVIGEREATLKFMGSEDSENRESFLEVLDVNCVSVIQLSTALLPNIQASQDKNILVISSTMGSISENQQGGYYAYRASKSAVNAAMRSFAIDVAPLGVHVMLIHPGWVKTRMGGTDALIEASESVAGILKQAELYFSDSHAAELRRFDGGVIAW